MSFSWESITNDESQGEVTMHKRKRAGALKGQASSGKISPPGIRFELTNPPTPYIHSKPNGEATDIKNQRLWGNSERQWDKY